MFDPSSRYYKLEELRYREGASDTIVYKARRFLSREEDRDVWWEDEVTDSDRPDLVAARTLQRSELFWRICDANEIMRPFELTERAGRKIRILMPGA